MAYNCNMHLSPVCTVAITGLKELGTNVKLLCNSCVEQIERDNSIRCRTLAKVAEKTDSLDVGGKLENMERRLTELGNG